MIALDSVEIVDKDNIQVSWFDNGNHWETWDSGELFSHIVEQYDEIERQKEIIMQLDIKNLELTTTLKEVRKYIDGNLENTSQTLRFDENKSYNTALLELKEILDKEE